MKMQLDDILLKLNKNIKEMLKLPEDFLKIGAPKCQRSKSYNIKREMSVCLSVCVTEFCNLKSSPVTT